MAKFFSVNGFVVTVMMLIPAFVAIAQQDESVNNPLAVPSVELDQYGFFTVADCPTTHDVLEVKLHEGEYCIDRADIYADGMLMQSVPISEQDAITRKVVHFLDANFDGNVDILIGPGCNREYSTLILWDREDNCFARASNDGFTVFNGDFYYEPERMAVYRMTSSSAFETTYTFMTWQGTDLQSEELFLQVFDPSYYDFYHVKHRYTVRGYYTGEDIGSDNPNDIFEPWDKWVITWNDND
jgi:hypothetical protein